MAYSRVVTIGAELCVLAKKNERVKTDLDGKIARLNATKAELDKIKGSKVHLFARLLLSVF